MMFGFLVPLVLANRLLVREYAGRTQLFVETLPIGRARTFATKWLLGSVLTLLTAGLAWFVSVETPANRLHWLAPEPVASGRVCVQPGVRIGGERLLEPWTCLPLSEAVEAGAGDDAGE